MKVRFVRGLLRGRAGRFAAPKTAGCPARAVALIAPRHAMLATARSDSEGDDAFADEQNVLANAASLGRGRSATIPSPPLSLSVETPYGLKSRCQ